VSEKRPDGPQEDENSPAFQALLEEIGSRVRVARLAAKLTQRDLAEAVGLKQGYITALESGDQNPTVRTLARFAEALQIPIASLFPSLPEAPPTDAELGRFSSVLERLEPLFREAAGALGDINAMRAVVERVTRSEAVPVGSHDPSAVSER
jgi:transcriptional regulator with XRE-family HTH domain